MNDRSLLLNLALNNPADDTCRLVLSDLLREMDDPTEQARGRFLWAGVTASRFRHADLIEDPLYYSAHQEIEEVVSAEHPLHWLAELGIGEGSQEKWAWDCRYDRVTVRVGADSATFTRGMLSKVEVTRAKWYGIAPRVLAESPIESIVIRDNSGLGLTIDHRGDQWKLTARIKVLPRRINIMGGPIPSSYSPSPMLIETDADWHTEETFMNRDSMLDAIVETSKELINALKEELGNRWPRGGSDS